MTELLVKIAFGLAIVFLAVYYSVQYISRKHTELEEENTPEPTKQELENAKLAEELYNKDLRPIVAKKAPKEEKQPKPEFPIDKPKKKRKYYPKKK